MTFPLDHNLLRPSAMRAMRNALLKDIEEFGSGSEHQYELIIELTQAILADDGQL